MNIERLLLIVEQYVLTVEEIYHQSRSILPHGSSFYGSPLTVNCECETRKEHFIIQVSVHIALVGGGGGGHVSYRSLFVDTVNLNVQFIQLSRLNHSTKQSELFTTDHNVRWKKSNLVALSPSRTN